MIRLRDPYIKPPVIVDRLPEPVKLTSYPTGLTIYPSSTSSWVTWSNAYAVNRFISASGYWHCASNWSLGHVPTPNEDVQISGVGQVYCLVHGDVQIHDLTVANRVYLEIGAHAHVQAHTLTLESNAWLNLGSSEWQVSGAWATGEAHVDGGTSNINFVSQIVMNPLPYVITTSGSQFYGGVNANTS